MDKSFIIKRAIVFLFLCYFFQNSSIAQPQKGRFIDAAIGLGTSAAYDDIDFYGSGFFAKAEYVMGFKTWVGVRPYAGVLFVTPRSSINFPGTGASSNIIFLGGKGRLVAPIPYVAPFLELGLGVSIGNLTTITPMKYSKSKGLIPHIPFSLGVALGKNHTVELAVTYLYHTSAEQFSGAAAVGLSFPLN